MNSVTQAVDTTWTFNGNGNWNVPGNWSAGEPTNNTFNVFIDDGDTAVTVTLNVVRTINNLTIGNNDSLSFNNDQDLTLEGTVVNGGLIVMNSVGTSTDLILGGATPDLTLSGAGELRLGSNVNNRVLGTGTLTNSATHSITGGGLLGANGIGIANAGLINANINGAQMVIDPGVGFNVTNTGTIQASNGGFLELRSGSFINTGGVIQALNGSIIDFNGAEITGGTFSSAGTGTFRVISASTLNGVTLGSSTPLQIINGVNVTLIGTITNNGAVLQNSIGTSTDMLLSGNVTLGGTGTWSTSANFNNRWYSLGAATDFILTNGASHTIRGSGNIGVDDMGLINNGLIDANLSGNVLTIDPNAAADADGFGADVVNSNIMQASNGGTLTLGGGTYSNSTGTIQALTGSAVVLNADAVIQGGNLASSGTGLIQTGASSPTLDGVTLASGSLLRMLNGHDLILAGTITNNGSVEQNSLGTSTDVMISGNVTLGGTGTWSMSANVNNRWYSLGAATNFILTNSASHTIRGSGDIGVDDMGLINNGLIDANLSGNVLTIDPEALADADGFGADVVNNSTMQASSGGTLTLGNGTYNNSTGTIQALTGSAVVLNADAVIQGGNLASSGTGLIQTGASSPTLDGVTLASGSLLRMLNGHDLILGGTITNNGSVEQNSLGTSTDVMISGNVTLGGTGTWSMSPNVNNRWYTEGAGAAMTLTNNSTISGVGEIGTNDMGLINNGLIDANQAAALTIDPAEVNIQGFVDVINGNTGIFRGSGTGGLQLTGGGFYNDGVVEALNGSNVTYSTTAITSNNVAGELKAGGTWRAVSTGSAATLTLRGTAIHTIASDTTVELSGALADIQVVSTDLQSSLTTNNGTLKLLNGHTFNMTNALTNTGMVELGGASLAGATLNSGGNITNSSTGEIFGHGAISDTILNSGVIRAVNGTLTVNAGIIDGQSGTIQIDPAAVLDLSAASGDSDTDFLIHNGTTAGSLNLGGNNLLVRNDYTNANFGVGNAFTPRANVTGAGQINASPAVQQTITGDVSNGTTATATLNLGNIRVGDNVTKNYAINNVGATGPVLRGAVQTNVNGANISDARLSGAGLGAQNFGPLSNDSATGNLPVTFTGTTAGALTGQQLAITNNFDNVADQQLVLSGTAYNPAVLGLIPTSFNLGDMHVGDPSTAQFFTTSNNATAGAFSEDLLTNNFAASGDATYSGPSSTLILAGGSDNTSGASLSFATAGAKSGDISFDAYSNATVNNIGIVGITPFLLGSPSVNYTANVFRLADPGVPVTIDLGDRHVGAGASTNIVIQNLAAADGFSEVLSASVDSFNGDVVSASGSTPINPGSNSGALLNASLTTATAGAKSGMVNFDLTSLGAGTLSDTPLTGQSTTVSVDVYRLAAPVIQNTAPIDFGIVHVGDVVPTVGLIVKNNALNDGFSEKLDALAGGHGPGVVGGGSFDNLNPQSTDNSSMQVGIGTGSAANINANYVVDFTSDGDGVNSLGQTALGSSGTQVIAQVNNFADTEFIQVSGDGLFTENTELQYSLDFGTVVQNDPDPQANLKLRNDISALLPGDVLGGTWVISATGFNLTNFDPFANLAAGADLTNLLVALDTANIGVFSGTITLQSTGSNPKPYSGALPDVVINLSGTVEAIPEPASLALLALGSVFIHRRRVGLR